MSKFVDSITLWICVLLLLFVGMGAGFMLNGAGIMPVASFIASVATILAFLLAVKAYFHWKLTDTLSQQMHIYREIIMELAAFDLIFECLFSETILYEHQNKVAEFPSIEQRAKFQRVISIVDRLDELIIKCYAIDPEPCCHIESVSKSELATFTFNGDYLGRLKGLLARVRHLERLVREQYKIFSVDGYILSTLPEERNYNIGESFGSAESLVQVYQYIIKDIRDIELDLKLRIK
ncbi:hypothetical protein [uncultured Photobacterium sp.]|uniref:hypothetical protein n=1 Tax=uncultured Photobacterium sp. TaxID=173973 RepID=UPI002634ECC6|nr:hypothetical protein [uncultured Photobacterium sp.]